jgi:hypothetical protein
MIFKVWLSAMRYTHQTTIFIGKLMRNHWVSGILFSDKPIWQNLDGEKTHTGSELLITESIKIATEPKSQPTCPYIIDKSLMKSQKLIIDDVTSKNQRFFRPKLSQQPKFC